MEKYKVIIAAGEKMAQSHKEALERTGRFHVAYMTEDGLSCVQMVMVEKPRLLVLDLALRGLDGLEVLRRLNELLRNPPTCLVVTAGPRELCEEAIRLGADRCLLEPVAQEVLATRALDLFRDDMAGVTDAEIDWAVCQIARRLGAPVEMRGFLCLRVGVRLMLRDPTYGNSRMALYRAIQSATGLTGAVDKNLRDFVHKLFQKGDLLELEQCFGTLIDPDRAAVPNGVFLNWMAAQTTFLLKKEQKKKREELGLIS